MAGGDQITVLAYTSRKPDEVVGHMRATHFREYWEYTVEKVAVNAVMAGARSEYFPDELIPMLRREDIHVVVAGGETTGTGGLWAATIKRPSRLMSGGKRAQQMPRGMVMPGEDGLNGL